MNHIKRIAGFALIPLLTMVSTVLLLPLISSNFGPEGWAAVALGQSLGAFLSVIAGLAWQVVGAQRVASSGIRDRQIIFAESLKSRAAMLVVLLPLGGMLCYFLAPAHRWESVAFVLATSLNCLNASWFFAGTGQPRFVIRNEGCVRLVGYLLCIPALALSDSLWTYAAVLIVSGVVMATANTFSIFNAFSSEIWSNARSVWAIWREHFSGMAARGVAAAHQYLGVAIVSVFAPQTLAVFSALDNVQKTVNNGTSFHPQAFAWWVGSGTIERRAQRVKVMLWTTLLLGVLIAIGWMIVGSPVMSFLYSNKANVPIGTHWWVGTGMATFMMARSLGQLCLVPLGLEKRIYRASAVSASLGLPGLVLGLWLADLDGALIAIAATYGGVCVYYVYSVLTWSRISQEQRQRIAY